jgi:hypothetical protein
VHAVTSVRHDRAGTTVTDGVFAETKEHIGGYYLIERPTWTRRWRSPRRCRARTAGWRSLGPALVVGGTALSQVWLFIVAPLVGGVLAAGLHRLLYAEEDIRLAAEAQPAGETRRAAAS